MTGTELKNRREQLGITQTKLAAKLDAAPSTIARLEQLKDAIIPNSRLYELALDMVEESQFVERNLDGFDIRTSIEATDDAVATLSAWYKHQGREAPEIGALHFGGWNSLTVQQKVDFVIDWKKLVDKILG